MKTELLSNDPVFLSVTRHCWTKARDNFARAGRSDLAARAERQIAVIDNALARHDAGKAIVEASHV